MDDRTKTLAAVAIIIGFIVLIILIVGVFVSGKKVISPVPEEGSIRIIFVTPTPSLQTPSQNATPSVTLKSSPKPTVKPTATAKPTPTKSPESTPSAKTPASL